MNSKAKILARRTVYESPWVRVHTDRVAFPGGRIEEAHHCVEFPKQGVGAVVVDEAGRILMIRSHRYIFDTVDWEIPAGSFDPGTEEVLDAARREVEEETGYASRPGKILYVYYPMTGICRAVFHLVTLTPGACVGEFDKNEVAEVGWKTPEEVRKMLRSGEIRDGFSLSGVLLFLAGFDREEKQP